MCVCAREREREREVVSAGLTVLGLACDCCCYLTFLLLSSYFKCYFLIFLHSAPSSGVHIRGSRSIKISLSFFVSIINIVQAERAQRI